MTAAALLLGAVTAAPACSEERDLLTVTSAHSAAKSGERIAAAEIIVVAGGVYRRPMGWNFVIDNDPSWRTTVKGSIEVDAAAADSDYFRDS